MNRDETESNFPLPISSNFYLSIWSSRLDAPTKQRFQKEAAKSPHLRAELTRQKTKSVIFKQIFQRDETFPGHFGISSEWFWFRQLERLLWLRISEKIFRCEISFLGRQYWYSETWSISLWH
jgi:hypothetical protein